MSENISDLCGPNTPEDHLSEEEIEEFLRYFSAMEFEFKDMLACLDPHIERHLRGLAGSHFETMLKTPKDALKYFTDPDPKLRKAAVQIAYQHWNITAALATVYERMAVSDPNDDVRDSALVALGTCFSRTKDERIGHLLATIARDSGCADAIRLTAYMSLLRLHGMMDYTGTSPLVPLNLHEIDWAFVDQYCLP